MDCINPSRFGVGMLRRMNNGVLDPELFDAIDDDACPDFTESLNEGEWPYVINGDVFKNFGKGTEFSPFPRRE